MTLKEKIKLSETCAYNHGGRCSLNGYPPFDCERCSSFFEVFKPCECGGNAVIKSKYLYSHVGWGKSYMSYYAECENCGKRSKSFNSIDDINPERKVAEDWNRRVNDG